MVLDWVAGAVRPVEILPCTKEAGESALLGAQVTTRSPMGALAYNAAAILIDHGWLRILGAGSHDKFVRSIVDWNSGRSDGFYLVADDVLGGFFALDGGAFGGRPGNVNYLAPDSLGIESLDIGYSDFMRWALQGELNKFYESYYWPSWETEVSNLTGDQALSIYPFLCAEGPALAERHRAPVPVGEAWNLFLDLREQLGPAEA